MQQGVGNRQEVVDALHRNELDLAIMARPPKELRARKEPLDEALRTGLIFPG